MMQIQNFRFYSLIGLLFIGLSLLAQEAPKSATPPAIEIQQNKEKLVVVWSSADPMVAERVTLMYAHGAKTAQWFQEVTLVIWGPSAELISKDKDLQQKIAQMQKDGVIVKACIACATAYGVVDELKALHYEVLPMGLPLSNYLKEGYSVITF